MKLSRKQFDLLVMVLLALAAGFLADRFYVKGLAAIAIYFLLPSLYLCWREKKNYKKIFAALLIFGIPAVFIFDLIMEINNAWVSDPSRLVFAQKILGLIPVDYAIFYFVWLFSIYVFYEHFLDDEKNRSISKYIGYASTPFLIALIVVLSLFALNPRLLAVPYAYLVFGLPAIFLPLFFIIYKKPRLLPKLVKIGVFFAGMTLMIELVSLKTNLWIFPGQYFGLVSIFDLVFPLEEFVFWILLSAPAVIAYYEFSVDDGK